MNFNNVSQHGIKDMKIAKFILQETGTYNEQWKRPFTSQLDGTTANIILETASRNRNLTIPALAGVANRFIKPDSTVENIIQIPNGWNEKRLRFFLEVVTEDQIGNRQTEYLVGFTDHSGLSLSNFIDPNMRCYISTVTTTRTTYVRTPLGNQIYQNVIDSSHVLSNPNYTGITSANKVYGLRPEDIYSQIENAELIEGTEVGSFHDTRNQFNLTPEKSKRSNAISATYTTNILNAYMQTSRSSDATAGRSYMLDHSRAIVKSESSMNDPFITFIRNRNHQGGNLFNYSDLLALDPNISNVTVVLPMPQAHRASLHQAGSTASWSSSDGETVFASCISQSLPGYMLDYSINKIHLIATNQDIGGRINIKVADAYSLMSGVDISEYIQGLVFKLEHELFKGLSFNNQMAFMLDVRCDLLGESWISVSLNSSPVITYVCPSFCDALMTPVTTTNIDRLNSISNDFDHLLEQLGDNNIVNTSMQPNQFGRI